MDRPVTPSEAGVIRWLLDHAPVGDVSGYRLRPLEDLRVVGGCDCGCSSLFFGANEGHLRMIADASAVYSDGQEDLILWGREGEPIWLEVGVYDPRTPHPFPEIANLRTWEQRGLELLER